MFAKIFGQIFDSSIADDPDLRHMFMDLLVMADQYGIVDMTFEAIARKANMPLPKVRELVLRLEQPDPASRSKALDGARIARLDTLRTWGWRIVNYRKYRESATEEMLRMGDAERKKSYRDRFSPSALPLKSSTEEEGEGEANVTCPDESRHVPDITMGMLREVVEEWNCSKFPRCLTLSVKRKTSLVARLHDKFWAENWRQAIARVKSSAFCMGQNDRGWVATFDWFLQPDVVLKIMEGKYDNREVKNNGHSTVSELKAILMSKESIATDLREKYATQGPLGLDWRDKTKQVEYRKLKGEIKEVNARIAQMA